MLERHGKAMMPLDIFACSLIVSNLPITFEHSINMPSKTRFQWEDKGQYTIYHQPDQHLAQTPGKWSTDSGATCSRIHPHRSYDPWVAQEVCSSLSFDAWQHWCLRPKRRFNMIWYSLWFFVYIDNKIYIYIYVATYTQATLSYMHIYYTVHLMRNDWFTQICYQHLHGTSPTRLLWYGAKTHMFSALRIARK